MYARRCFATSSAISGSSWLLSFWITWDCPIHQDSRCLWAQNSRTCSCLFSNSLTSFPWSSSTFVYDFESIKACRQVIAWDKQQSGCRFNSSTSKSPLRKRARCSGGKSSSRPIYDSVRDVPEAPSGQLWCNIKCRSYLCWRPIEDCLQLKADDEQDLHRWLDCWHSNT